VSRTLVVGASQAGVQLAVSLRALSPDEEIVLAGAEAHPPYQRPPLSKELLGGTADPAAATLRTPEFYAEQRLDLLTSARVAEIALAPRSRGAGEAMTTDGRRIAFDRLALTVGSRPRRLTVPGAELDGVCYLRDLDDSLSLQTRLTTASSVVVVGGGFIGLEVAAVASTVARAAGRAVSVTVVEVGDRLLARAVDPLVSEFYRRAHVRRGSTVLLGTGVTAIEGDGGRATAVVLSDGRRLPADLVLVGVGVAPRTELAEQLGLRVQHGIVVDEAARTSRPGVVAAGDCTVQPNPVTGEGLVCLESQPNALSQARVAAATLAGATPPSVEVPWFWSDQFDLKLQTAGVATGADDVVLRGDPDDESFSLLYFRGDQLLAINAVNRATDYLAVRRALTARIPIDRAAAADESVALKELVLTAARAS
jgi:3-phenylpropionate/trans-cinnamate dioxygenase ferredoxin reductase subunit